MNISDLIASIAAVITSFGSFIAAVIAARKASTAANEVTPNHGGSLKDVVTRIEKMVRSQGHQIGEIRRDASVTHDQLGEDIDDVRHRLRRLEDRDERRR